MEMTPEFINFCEARKIIPEKLLAQFMADASKSAGNGGSNERDAAERYVNFVEHLVTADYEWFTNDLATRYKVTKRRSED